MNENITEEERKIMKLTVDICNSFSGMDQTHPSDVNDVRDAIHRVQDIIASRIARRVVPDVFITYTKR